MGFYRRSGFRDAVRGKRPGFIFDRLNKDYFAGENAGYEQRLANQNLAEQLNQSTNVSDAPGAVVNMEAIASEMSSYRCYANEKMVLWKLDPGHGKCAFCGLIADKDTQFTIFENQRPVKTRHLDPFPHCSICGRYFCPMHGRIAFNYAPDGYWVRCIDHPYRDGFWKRDPFDMDGDLRETWDVPSWDAQSAAARKSTNEVKSPRLVHLDTERSRPERTEDTCSLCSSPVNQVIIARQEGVDGEKRLSDDELARKADEVIARWKRRKK